MKTSHNNRAIFQTYRQFVGQFVFAFVLSFSIGQGSATAEGCVNETDIGEKYLCQLIALNDNLRSDAGLLKDKVLGSTATLLVACKGKENEDKNKDKMDAIITEAKKKFLENSTLLAAIFPGNMEDFFSFNEPSGKLINIEGRKNPTTLKYELVLYQGMKPAFNINKFVTDNCSGNTTTEQCENVVQEVQHLVRFAALGASRHQEIKLARMMQVNKNLTSLKESWEKYTSESRSQTGLELGLNTWLFSKFTDDYDEVFQGPPSWQLIVLHPNGVYEYIDDSAFDGEQGEIGAAFEIVGFDIWDRGEYDKNYIPTGFSLTANYADRAEVDDWGWGFLIHFKHILSVGYVNRDGNDAFTVSIDAWKLIDSKKGKLDEYRNLLNYLAF